MSANYMNIQSFIYTNFLQAAQKHFGKVVVQFDSTD